MGKNRKFPYRSFYHENPHLKSPKIPPIPCQARHGAAKQGCKSAFGTLAAPLIFVVIADIRQTLGMDISTWDYGAQPRLHHAALERKKARASSRSGRVSISFHIPCRHALIRIRCRVEGFARLHRQASAGEVQQHVHAAGSIVDDLAADAQQIPVFIRRHPAAGG